MAGWDRVRVSALVTTGALIAATFAGCGGDDRPPPASGDRAGVTGGRGGTAGTAGGGGTAGTGGAGEANCGDVVCKGEGTQCVDNVCSCKEGYLETLAGEEVECEVDKNCIKMRSLEGFCRVERLGAHAVGAFFAVDYCAGTAVLPQDLGDLNAAFQVLEDDAPLQSESAIRFIPRDVESFVMIALDVSSSLLIDNPETLRQVTGELESFVDTLGSDPGITVGLLGFAVSTRLIVPFTRDLSKVTTALQAIADDAASYLTPIFQEPDQPPGEVNFDGTVLVEGTERGVFELERMRGFRRVVTHDGVLTSGTLVVVTDGIDSNSADVPNSVKSTLVNVITVGIGNGIDGNKLAELGRDGVFLAPTSESMGEAFDAVAKRVSEHPDRSYLLGYCSAATTGKHEVTIVAADTEKRTTTTAGCEFNADVFGNAPCNPDTFVSYCETSNAQCGGGIYACGACRDDQCCVPGADVCAGPAPTEECNNQDELCQPGEEFCKKVENTSPAEYTCEPFVPRDGACISDHECEPGVAYCYTDPVNSSVKTCKAVNDSDPSPAGLPAGADCLDYGASTPPPRGALCASRNCARPNTSQRFTCQQEGARMFEPCTGSLGNATCEVGTYCDTTCKLRGPSGLFECSKHEACASGNCDTQFSKLCYGSDQCHYAWTDKLDGRY
jgi:hypothetical protein